MPRTLLMPMVAAPRCGCAARGLSPRWIAPVLGAWGCGKQEETRHSCEWRDQERQRHSEARTVNKVEKLRTWRHARQEEQEESGAQHFLSCCAHAVGSRTTAAAR